MTKFGIATIQNVILLPRKQIMALGLHNQGFIYIRAKAFIWRVMMGKLQLFYIGFKTAPQFGWDKCSHAMVEEDGITYSLYSSWLSSVGGYVTTLSIVNQETFVTL